MVGCGSRQDEADDGPTVVASTTWAGAYAKAAGATDVRVLNGAVQTDPLRTPQPSELATAAAADFVVFAESDPFAAELKAAAGDAVLVPVTLRYDRAVISDEVTRLGGILGASVAAQQWVTDFQATWDGIQVAGRSLNPIPPWRVVAEENVADWARFMGLNLVGVYQRGAVAAPQLARLRAARPKLQVDDADKLGAPPELGTPNVAVSNFPQDDLDMVPLIRRNTEIFTDAFNS
ncbi:hypothetical protein GCM10010201_05650 [Pilimelia columellifera subsp. columellifera]|uniref:Fe/B12 periplasmic-binding domain-containing protein n=2 Tax=Pilimelia TaxID=53370 RepID=A0ABN3N252_9ACTN